MSIKLAMAILTISSFSMGSLSAQQSENRSPNEENVTPRISGAIAEFPDGGYYEFGSNGAFVIMSPGGGHTVGSWRFKDKKKSLYCASAKFGDFRSAECRK